MRKHDLQDIDAILKLSTNIFSHVVFLHFVTVNRK